MQKLIYLSLLATGLSLIANAQSWEKNIMPGLNFRMSIDSKTPRTIYSLRMTNGAPSLTYRTEVSQMKLFAAPKEQSRQEISILAKQAGAIAAINGDFFGASGEPLGAMIRDGELVSRPFKGRAVFGWGPNSNAIALLDWRCNLTTESGQTIAVDGLNEDVQQDRIVLFTDACYEARTTPPSVMVLVKLERPGFAPSGIQSGRVVQTVTDYEKFQIPTGHIILAATGKRINELSEFTKNQRIVIQTKTDGLDWSKIDNVIGGGPLLVRNGATKIDFETASFSKDFSTKRHPRTAIGRTFLNEIVMMIVDGRQPMSAGCSLEEMSELMIGQGCMDAINLDGGGSSTLSILGEVLNRPSDARERKVSNGILIFGPPPTSGMQEIVIKGPHDLTPLGFGSYEVTGSDGKPVPDRDVLWSAMGAGGWVDQGGTVRTLAAGTITLRANVKGVSTQVVVNVIDPNPKPDVKPIIKTP